jgi:thiamine biosynthesis lipoprotein
MKRRRFLTIIAAAAVAPRAAPAQEWRGEAFGADICLQVDGAAPMAEIRAEIAEIEATFSLFAASELTRLNRAGGGPLSARMRGVLEAAAQVHAATAGCFDPTVQPLWQALATGGDATAARALIGFDRLQLGAELRMAPGQALTLNGIAQGHAADCIAALLARAGHRNCLIDMGEFAALGGPWRLAVEDPGAGRIGTRSLYGPGAIATSSPGALALPGGSHILGPRGEAPRWSTVSVEGPSAMMADAAATAFVLMEEAAIRAARGRLGLGAVTLVGFDGDARVI